MLGAGALRIHSLFSADKNTEPLPHPGVYFGAYPHRKITDKGWIEEFLRGLLSFSSKPEAAHKKHWQKFTQRVEAMDLASLETSLQDLRRAYEGRAFPLAAGGEVCLDTQALLRAVVKYGGAIAHSARMDRRLRETAAGAFEVEVSVDETDRSQSPLELFFLLAMLAREGIPVRLIAPRFTGRFYKGVDYVGEVDRFAAELDQDLAVVAHARREFGLSLIHI